jgi:hypothetical protein
VAAAERRAEDDALPCAGEGRGALRRRCRGGRGRRVCLPGL